MGTISKYKPKKENIIKLKKYLDAKRNISQKQLQNPNAEGFGDVYYDHAATNKLYNHSDYYENSDGTDATLKDLNNKASIVLTPTAYSDGSLNTVIPPYGFGSELIVNGDFASGTSPFEAYQCTLSNVNNTLVATATSANDSRVKQVMTTVSGKKYKITADLLSLSGSKVGVTNRNGNSFTYSGDVVERTTSGKFVLFFTAESTQTTVVFKMFGASIGESFSIDNVSVKEIQEADFDFSRGSSATRVNEQGLVEDVQILSGELVQNGDFEQIGSELVTNGNFETDSDWNLRRAVIENGVGKFQESVGTYARIRQDINFTGQAKITYTISFNNSSNTTIGLRSYGGGNNEPISAVVGTHTVYRNFISDGISFQQGGLASDEEIHLDNVSVKEVGQNWSGINGATLSFDSNRAVVTIAAQSGSGLASDSTVSVQSGKKYKLEADVEIGTYTGTSVILNLLGTSSSAITIASSGVTRVSHIFDASSTTNTSARVLRGSADTGTLFIDNVSVIEITDDTDLPRIDFTDGTGSLLLEPQRTNLVTYSEDFSGYIVQVQQ